MKTAILTNIATGESVKVHATTEHPSCSYGRAVWVDSHNNPYCEVDNPSPFYSIKPCPEEKYFRAVHAHIGQSIAALRQHNGWTIEEASARSGLTVKKIAALERGVLFNNVNALAKIVESLHGRIAIIPEESPDDPHCQFVELVEG